MTWHVILACGGAGYAIGYELGETIQIDDFDDLNDDGWTHFDLSEGEAWGPGSFAASSGEYHLFGAGEAPVGKGGALLSAWDASSAPAFADGFLRGKIRAENDTTLVMLLTRFGGIGTGYAIGGNPITGRFFLSKGDGGREVFVDSFAADEPFQAGQDWILEAGAVGDQLSIKAWKLGEGEPSEPQWTYVDSSSLPAGLLGVTTWHWPLQETPAGVVDVTYDDVYFTFPADPWTTTHGPEAIYTVRDDGSDSSWDDLGDVVSDKAARSRASVGEADSETNAAVSRLVAKFNVPAQVASPFFEKATLRFFFEDMIGIPEGPVSVWHSVADNAFDPLLSDYEDDGYEDTARDLVGPTGADQKHYEVDVTDLVLEDYAADGDDPISAFRLQINEIVFVDDDQEGRYRFTMPGAETNHPELVLTFIPEPSTFGLTTVGLLGIITYGRHRPKQSTRRKANRPGSRRPGK